MLGIFRECLIYNVIETSSRWLLARDGQGGGGIRVEIVVDLLALKLYVVGVVPKREGRGLF